MVISVLAVSIEIIDKFAQAGGSRLKTIYRFLRHEERSQMSIYLWFGLP